MSELERERTAPRAEAVLDITGMTCASCVARVEKRLQRVDGVTATVNLATESARVEYPADLAPARLVAAVREAAEGHASERRLRAGRWGFRRLWGRAGT